MTVEIHEIIRKISPLHYYILPNPLLIHLSRDPSREKNLIAETRGKSRESNICNRHRVTEAPVVQTEKYRKDEENLRGFWTCTGDGGLVRVTTTGGGILACKAARHEFATS